jgi:uncharacterized membrane protein SpoIIM required for sporulation
VIVDLPRFLATERPFWEELEAHLQHLEAQPDARLSLADTTRFHYLYERCASDLARLDEYSEPETRRHLDNLVARAYGEIHETRHARTRLRPLHWLRQTFPQTFRRHARAFALSVTITLTGSLFGAGALAVDPEAKAIITPFPHLLQDPADRVAEEEKSRGGDLEGHKSSFSAQLMTHNTKVSILALALGISWGIGTVVLLFYNGVILGAVAFDYIQAGQSVFLLGWLLPHGSVEIPAILIAGQAGLVLAGALIGRGDRHPLRARLRTAGADLVTLILGVALLLIWAGLVESFLSQYHEPVLPYEAKIAIGVIQLTLLAIFLTRSGRGSAAR